MIITSLVKQFTWNAALSLKMEIIRLHCQRRGFDFLKKHSLARNLSSSVSIWEGWDEVSDCHSSLCSWCMSQEAQKSTAAASSFFFLRGGSLTLSSVSSEAQKHYREWELCCWDWECQWLSLGVIHDALVTQGASLTGSVSCLMSDSSAAACWLVLFVHIFVTSVAVCRPLINAT